MSRERGAALLLVVVLVGLLAVVVMEFLREAGLELRAAANLRDALQARALARSGVAVPIVLLQADSRNNSWDGRKDLWALPVILPLPDGNVTVTTEELDGKFPLGALVDKGKPVAPVVDAYRRLLESLDLEGADIGVMVDALIDWIDEDERGSYEQSEKYTVPNAPLEQPEDLERVAGYTPDVLKPSALEKLLDRVDTRSEKTVNVNWAPKEVLVALHPAMTLEQAEELLADVEETPLENVADLKNRAGMQGLQITQFALQPVVESTRFRARIEVDVGGVVSRPVVVLVRDPKKKGEVSIAAWREAEK